MFDQPWVYQSGADWGFPDLARALNTKIFSQKPARNFTRALGDIFEQSVLVTNLGRTALWLGLKALGLGHGDKIIVPSLVCPTVVLAIMSADCQPVFCDVDPGWVTVNLKNIQAVHDNEVRAVLVPHLFGLTAPISEIEKWCQEHELFLIDDAAQCFGSRYEGRLLGTYGDFGILSFGPFKAVSSLRGGALVSRHPWLIDKAANMTLQQEPSWTPFRRCLTGYVKFCRGRTLFRNLGPKVKKHSRSRKILNSGGSLNETFMLSGLDASLTARLVTRHAEITDRRIRSANRIYTGLKDNRNFKILGSGDLPYTKIPIFLEEPFTAEDFVKKLRKMKIEVEHIYRPLGNHEKYDRYRNEDFIGSDLAHRKVVLLPNPSSDINKAKTMVKKINSI